MLKVSVRQLARYESGESEPTASVLTRMAEVFSVSTDYLLGRTDDATIGLKTSDLAPKELAILAALRRGEHLEAIKLIVSESQ
jgi:transcriptional regulator with XRE-family HTH domain